MEAKFPDDHPGLFQHLPHKCRGLSPLRTLRSAPRQAQPPRRPFPPAGSFRPARRQRRPRRREKSCRRLCRGRWTADPAAAPASIPRGRRGNGSIAAAVDKRKGGAAPGYERKSAVSTGPDTALRGHARKGRHALASDTDAGQSHWNFRGTADRRETAAEPRISGGKPPSRLSLSAFRKWTSPFRPRPRRVQPRPVPCRRVPGTDARPIADLPRLCPAPGGASFPPPDARKVCGNCLGPGDSPRKKGGAPCRAADRLSRTGATGFSESKAPLRPSGMCVTLLRRSCRSAADWHAEPSVSTA